MAVELVRNKSFCAHLQNPNLWKKQLIEQEVQQLPHLESTKKSRNHPDPRETRNCNHEIMFFFSARCVIIAEQYRPVSGIVTSKSADFLNILQLFQFIKSCSSVCQTFVVYPHFFCQD